MLMLTEPNQGPPCLRFDHLPATTTAVRMPYNHHRICFNRNFSSLLDEVTTHLDLATIKALAVALRGFEGAIVLVTHDRWFCRVVIEGAPLRGPADDESDEGEEDEEDEEAAAKPRGQVYRVNKGQVVELSGGMDEYVQKVEKELARKAKADAALMSR
jgi:hypothetical protein